MTSVCPLLLLCSMNSLCQSVFSSLGPPMLQNSSHFSLISHFFLNKCVYFAPFRFSHIFISHPCKIKNSEPVTFSHCWLTATLVSVWSPSAPREAPSFPKACITLVSVSCHWSLPLPLWSACWVPWGGSLLCYPLLWSLALSEPKTMEPAN